MNVRHRVFARMWGVAMLAHLAGNWAHGDVWPEPTPVGVVLLVIGLVGTAAVVAPRPWMLLALGVLVPAAVVLEAPMLGNHWLLAGFVSLSYLVTGGRWDQFEPAARVILLVFYGFAAFAKLNTGFLDPSTSCGVFYANHLLDGFGLRTMATSSPLAWVSAWGAGLVELAIPILVLLRRTRTIGVMVAIAFHGLISLDLAQHFYDFTAVLLALFVLLLPDSFAERFEAVGQSVRPLLRSVLVVATSIVGSAVTVASVIPLTAESAWWLMTGSFLWWLPYLALVAWAGVGLLESVTLKGRIGPAAAVVIALVALNGLTPYLEVKTTYGWNMYSNLVTVDGTSNHLLVRSTLPIRAGHRGLVTVVSSDDPGLQIYADEGYLLPWPSFRMYAVAHPDAAVVIQRFGSTSEVPRVGDDPDLSAPVPWWWRWMPLRAVHGETPQQCQPVFLPAL